MTSDEESDAEYDSAIAYEINDENTVTYFTKELTSHVVNHTLTSVEYPATSAEGVAYVFNIEDTKSTNESLMTPMEKLEYEDRMLLIEERKEKLRELRIANTIKEREHGLEQE
ncbi:hypothetical protein C2G38_2137072 [Gigaspora rosea]|uniref:Uncharacterized protein n=1 Tax=Gigaspora rosea TaxID=44941 RepID=A0A397W2M3_9GLOM|nr:hypothetical protein C2G38_2137072 [Gigaspora rosea]